MEHMCELLSTGKIVLGEVFHVCCELEMNMPSLMKECPDCSTVVHVRKLGCPCGHVFGKSKSLTVKCTSKQTLKADKQLVNMRLGHCIVRLFT